MESLQNAQENVDLLPKMNIDGKERVHMLLYMSFCFYSPSFLTARIIYTMNLEF